MDYYRSTATRLFLGAAAGEPDGIPIIDDTTSPDMLFPRNAGFGHDPSQYVPDMMAAPLGMTVIPDSEYDARFDEQEAAQSSLEHMYLRAGWENLDQNGHGYCWKYSGSHAVMLRRMAMNLPYVRLNPHAAAAIIKGGRDEGGWCGLGLAFSREHGEAVEGTGAGEWPLHSRDLRYDTPALRASMARHKVTDDWYDLGKPAYGQQLKVSQLATCLFNNNPSPTDWNEWAHSVCAIRWVRIEAGSWAPLILNSWKGWGRRGLAVIRKWDHDGAVSIVNVTATA